MKDYAVWKTHLGTKTTLIAQRRDKANHKRFRAQYAQTTKDSIQHTCQVSRIGRVTHAFRPNLTLTRIKLKISRIPQIIIKSHALSNKIGRVHQSALHVLCGIILVFSQGSLDCPDTLRTRTRSRQRPWARLRRECNWQSW